LSSQVSLNSKKNWRSWFKWNRNTVAKNRVMIWSTRLRTLLNRDTMA